MWVQWCPRKPSSVWVVGISDGGGHIARLKLGSKSPLDRVSPPLLASGTLVTRDPPTSTPSSGLMPHASFSQPAKWRAPSSSPIPAGVSLGFKEFPTILMPPSLSPCLQEPTLHPGSQGGGLEQGLPSSGHVPDTWHLPATAACLLWPGPADRGAQECGVGGGNSQPATLHSVPRTPSCSPFRRPGLSVSASGSWTPA